jgi:hypothetical protein
MVVAASATVVKDCVVGSPWLYCLGWRCSGDGQIF